MQVRLKAQQGFALLITLIIMVILTLSTLAMMLVMKGGVSAAGNIAFRQAAVRVADQAVEAARVWLQGSTPATLQVHDEANGYFATNTQVPVGSPCPTGFFAPTCYDFYDSLTRNPKNARRVGGLPDGYNVYYVIHRMAVNTGSCSDPLTGCMFPPVASSSGTLTGQSFTAGASYSRNISSATGFVYYRVSVKVAGPRNNNRYVQAFMY